jgi:ribA/ribD-fused uncharacterized protein
MNVIDKFKGKYAFLSNFTPCKVVYNGRTYRTVEHAFQAAKSLDIVEQKLFQFVGDPAEAKKWGKQVKLRKDWEQVKETIMKELLTQKFNQKKFKELLLETADATLIEGNNHRDTYWGVYKGNGKNRLGELLMEVREDIKAKENT